MSASVTVRRFGGGEPRALLHLPLATTDNPQDGAEPTTEVPAATDRHLYRLAEVAAEVAIFGRTGSILLARTSGSSGEVIGEGVDHILEESGRCLLVELRSYPARPSPAEADLGAPRPEVCLGTDPFHTPAPLANLARLALGTPDWGADTGTRTVADNTPYAGSFVPPQHLRRDRRLRSVTISLRRDTYLDEPDTWRDPDATRLAVALGRFLRFALEPVAATATGLGPCPACGSDAVVPLAYGMPGPAMADAARRGEIALGGCVIVSGSPRLSCRSCDGRFIDLRGEVTWPWGRPR